MKVINLFGGPGIGKSTLAAVAYVTMKFKQLNVELIREYAKDLVYENHDNILRDQQFILAHQNRQLKRLDEYGVEYAVTDSPLLLSAFYELVHSGKLNEHLVGLCLDKFNEYDNYNFLLKRDLNIKYQTEGRLQDLSKAIKIDEMLYNFLAEYHIPYVEIYPSEFRQIFKSWENIQRKMTDTRLPIIDTLSFNM